MIDGFILNKVLDRIETGGGGGGGCRNSLFDF